MESPIFWFNKIKIIQTTFVCSNKEKWNKNKCRCQYLINKECNNNEFWNLSNCECEYRKKAAYLTEECEEIIDA